LVHSDEANEQFWFNVATRKVERGQQSLALNRLGPFDTEEDALRAEEIVRQRGREIALEDEAEWRER
jgi:hypothetical protein